MNKEEFNKLLIVDQMIHINSLLTTMSLTKACESIGIDRGTVRKRFKSLEISFNKELNKYVFDVPYEKYKKEDTTENTVTTTATTELKKKLPKKTSNLEGTKTLEAKINSLEEQIKDIYSLINTMNTKNTSLEKIKGNKKDSTAVQSEESKSNYQPRTRKRIKKRS